MSDSTKYQINPKLDSTQTGQHTQLFWAQRVNEDVTTNLNDTIPVTVPIDGNLSTLGHGWAIAGDGIELTGPDSWVRVSCSVHISSGSEDVNLTLEFALNGTPLNPGPVSASNYIDGDDGNSESSSSIPGYWVYMEMGDVITIEALREANSGTVTLAEAGTSYLLLERYVNV